MDTQSPTLAPTPAHSSPPRESLSPGRIHIRPLCPCCGGGRWRKGYTCTKAKSRKLSDRASKPETFTRESIRFLSSMESL